MKALVINVIETKRTPGHRTTGRPGHRTARRTQTMSGVCQFRVPVSLDVTRGSHREVRLDARAEPVCAERGSVPLAAAVWAVGRGWPALPDPLLWRSASGRV